MAAYTPAPYVSYYAPPVAYTPRRTLVITRAAVPRVTYYARPAVAYAPVVPSYRVYYAVPGVSIYGMPRVYVPGEPVRNVGKAVLP